MRIVVIGAGDVGFYLASRLSDEAHEVVLIDADPEKFQNAVDKFDVLTIRGSGAGSGRPGRGAGGSVVSPRPSGLSGQGGSLRC